MGELPEPRDVAEFMVQALDTGNGELCQQDIVWDIEEQFGDSFTYTNDNGNRAIRKDVLDEFNKLTKDTVVWSRSGRYWRWRANDDGPGRMVD